MGLDRGKLTKLLMLTTSDFDGEALSAIRMANSILKKEKLNWADIIRDEIRVKYEAKMDEPSPDSIKVSRSREAFRASGIQFTEHVEGYKGGFHFTMKHRGDLVDYFPLNGWTFINGKKHKWSLTTLMMYLNNS